MQRIGLFVGSCFVAFGQDVFLAKQESPPRPHKFSWKLHEESSEQHSLGYKVTKSTYISDPMPLAPGEMVFTKIHDTIITMPEGKYAITNVSGGVSDAQGNDVPLSTVYNHHWILRPLKKKPHFNRFCNGQINYIFGVGAESRDRPADLAPGYGYIVEDGEVWGANLHLLHTEDLAGPAKECNECWYGPNKGPKCSVAKNGTFDCCGDGGCAAGQCKCTTVHGYKKTTNYYLKYNIYWTSEVDKITGIDAGVIAAPNCQSEHNVMRNNHQTETVSSATWIEKDGIKLVKAVGHLHTGGINISLYVNDNFVCTSKAIHGTQVGVVGNEYDHLVDISPCFDAQGSNVLMINKGDKVRVDSIYYVGDDDDRISPGSGGTHLGVMSYMNMFYVDDIAHADTAKCQNKVSSSGCELQGGDSCIACAKAHRNQLAKAGCTVSMVSSMCEPS